MRIGLWGSSLLSSETRVLRSPRKQSQIYSSPCLYEWLVGITAKEKKSIQHMIVTGNMGLEDDLSYFRNVCSDVIVMNGVLDHVEVAEDD